MTTAKTVCPVSRNYFAENAKPLSVLVIDGYLTNDDMEALRKVLGSRILAREQSTPRTFSTDSLGWNVSTKISVPVGPVDVCKVQVGANFTVVGSKELPKDAK